MAKEVGYVSNEAVMFAKVHPHLRKTWIETEVETMAAIARDYTAHHDEMMLAKKLAQYKEDFRWIRMTKWTGEPIDETYARKRFEEEKRNCEEGNYITPRHSAEKPGSFIAFSVAVAYWRAECGRVEMETAFRMKSILQMLADRLKVSYKHILLLSPSEMVSVAQGSSGNIHLSEILKREKGFFNTVVENGEELILHSEDPEYQKIKELYLTFDESKKSDVLYGVGAAPGVVKGRVCIIHSMQDAGVFKDGEILVASETTPSFVPLMRMASAILTGKGGITSHAAIVSRELKKPCIIGIKDVTKILKDGDLVEVDAERGIVKILKRNKKEK